MIIKRRRNVVYVVVLVVKVVVAVLLLSRVKTSGKGIFKKDTKTHTHKSHETLNHSGRKKRGRRG